MHPIVDRVRALGQRANTQQFKRFLLSGALNTGATYIFFLVLLQFFSYRLAYSATYASGILLAYILNSRFVFRKRYTVRMGLGVLLTYSVQYLYGLLVLSVAVSLIGMAPSTAMIVVILTVFPLQFLILRSVAETISKDLQ